VLVVAAIGGLLWLRRQRKSAASAERKTQSRASRLQRQQYAVGLAENAANSTAYGSGEDGGDDGYEELDLATVGSESGERDGGERDLRGAPESNLVYEVPMYNEEYEQIYNGAGCNIFRTFVEQGAAMLVYTPLDGEQVCYGEQMVGPAGAKAKREGWTRIPRSHKGSECNGFADPNATSTAAAVAAALTPAYRLVGATPGVANLKQERRRGISRDVGGGRKGSVYHGFGNASAVAGAVGNLDDDESEL
jgi:hypothetical protein